MLRSTRSLIACAALACAAFMGNIANAADIGGAGHIAAGTLFDINHNRPAGAEVLLIGNDTGVGPAFIGDGKIALRSGIGIAARGGGEGGSPALGPFNISGIDRTDEIGGSPAHHAGKIIGNGKTADGTGDSAAARPDWAPRLRASTEFGPALSKET